MDENRVSGTAKNLGGKIEEGLGRATGDAKSKAEGQMKQAEGNMQDLYGQAKDSAGEAVDAVRRISAPLKTRSEITSRTIHIRQPPSRWVSGGLSEGHTGRSKTSRRRSPVAASRAAAAAGLCRREPASPTKRLWSTLCLSCLGPW